MLKVKAAGVALNQTPFDWTGNRSRIIAALKEARAQGASVVGLPELGITGYGCEDAFFNPHIQETAMRELMLLIEETAGLFVGFGLPVRHKGVLFNCIAAVYDGKLLGFVAKKALAGDGVHYEPRWFKPWQSDLVSEIEVEHEGRREVYPFGDLHFDIGGVKIGFEICEEAWVANRPGALLARRDVDIILNPSASHFAFGKLGVRSRFVCEGSRAFSVGYVYSNLIGNEAGRIVYDGGVLIADGGTLVAQGPRFSYQDVLVTAAVLDLDRNRVTRERTFSYQPDLRDSGSACVSIQGKLATEGGNVKVGNAQVGKQGLQTDDWENSRYLKAEEFSRAVALGLFDFLRKSRQQGFVISLSGGLDSAAVSILCRMSFEFAAKELGFDGLLKKLSHIPNVQNGQAKNLDDLARILISCAYQGTENSSKKTLQAAELVAKDIGATFYNWSIASLLSGYHKLAEDAIGEKLSWERHDIPLQNIQARTRGPAIWMIANLKNALLLATSNRSEAAVGYATMDGDTCGGISPIGGIDKAFLREWAKWLLDSGPAGIRRFSGIEAVVKIPPTAELRPEASHQTDEDDLMPYEILDRIERLAIRDHKSPLDVYLSLKADELGDTRQLKSWTAKFFRLWSRNQWKRERYAPAFHLDDESLDPKTWCRFPILSSGFEEELRLLESYQG